MGTSIIFGASQSFSQQCQATREQWRVEETVPPTKKQCRSQSIPGDGQLHSQWLQYQNTKHLHRPEPVRPHSGGSRHKGSHQYSRHHQGFKAAPRVWSLTPNIDVFRTPPESPVPRPSSASSGYYDSPLASVNNLTKQRCESLQQLPGTSSSLNSAKSMPSVAAFNALMPSSPKRHRIPRCRSQPCVMHERRAGVKRRRDEDQSRPCLNFSKMTEVSVLRSLRFHYD